MKAKHTQHSTTGLNPAQHKTSTKPRIIVSSLSQWQSPNLLVLCLIPLSSKITKQIRARTPEVGGTGLSRALMRQTTVQSKYRQASQF